MRLFNTNKLNVYVRLTGRLLPSTSAEIPCKPQVSMQVSIFDSMYHVRRICHVKLHGQNNATEEGEEYGVPEGLRTGDSDALFGLS